MPAFLVPRFMVGRLLLGLAALCLASCASTPPSPPTPLVHSVVFADPGQFGSRPDIPGPAEIHQLNRPQRNAFLDYLDAPANDDVPLHQRVYNYLQVMTKDFHYQGKTFAAAESLNRGSGNCLSLAILTTALAKLAGVDIGYQLMDDEPVFQVNGRIAKKGVHVRSILYDPEWQAQEQEPTLVFSSPGIKIDYFPTSGSRFIANLNEDGYLAMYYRNIAAEAIEREDYRTAYWYALESLNFAPDHFAALNMLAVTYGRVGDVRKAEAVYLHGLQRADEKLGLLRNYRVLLLRTGRIDEAQDIEQRLERMDDPSPFHWFQLARSAYGDREYALAIGYYRRALELAPYMHEGYLGLAKAYYSAGQLQRAEAALQDALDSVDRSSTRSLYQAKLAVLSREMHR